MPLKRPSETSIICFFLFGLLPFVYLPVSQDPELTLRYFMLTVLLVSIGILMIFRKLPITTHFWKEPVLLTFGGYLVVTILSLTKTINFGDGVYELTKIMVCFFFLLLMIQLLRNRPDWISKLPLFVTFAAFAFSIIGLFQFIPMIIDTLSHGTVFAIKNNVTSTLSNKNFFAETLVIALPFSVYTFICHKSYLRWGALFTAIISFLLILIIQSASAYFAIAIQIIVAIFFLFIYRKLFRNTALFILYKTRFLVFTAIAFLIIPVSILVFFPDKIDYSQLPRKWVAIKAYVKAPDKIFEKDNVKNNNSVYDRLFLARNSILMAKENPILGNGVANWKILYPKFGLYGNNFMSVGTLRFEHPHNDYLLVLCESGILGLLSWLAFLSFILITTVRNIKKSEHPDIRILLFLLLLSLISFVCTSLFGYPKERFFSMLLLLCLTAIIVALKETKPQTLKSSNKIFLFFSVGILITISWIHLERYRSEIYVNAALLQQKKKCLFTNATTNRKSKKVLSK
ncbi:MAG: O-antigen ligase family protein [Bacteroidetes bacterium]|nr:O-antigen ligase family protein [Bacteroidota bacterium]